MSRKNKANTHTQHKQTTIGRMNGIKDKPAPHDDDDVDAGADADAAALLSVRKTIQIVKRDRIEPIRRAGQRRTRVNVIARRLLY